MFHLENRLSKNVVLPGKFAQCYAQGDMVAFVTKQGHVVIWGWSDTAYELEIDHGEHFHQPNGWEKDLGGVPGVMFHPTDTDIVFAGWLNSPPLPGKCKVLLVGICASSVNHVLSLCRLSHPHHRHHQV